MKGKKTGGRKEGVPNKATKDVREAIALVAQNNVDKFEGWLDRVAEVDPDKACDLFLKMIEYHIPKLARSELTGPNGTGLFDRIERQIVRPPNTDG